MDGLRWVRGRFSHESELPHSVWLAERAARAQQQLEDLVFVECTAQYPAAEKLIINSNPLHLGHPARRPRVFACLLNNSTISWVGQSNWQDEYQNMFHCTQVVGGSALLAACDEERATVYQQMAHQQKMFISKDKASKLSETELLQTCLSPGQQQRVARYLSKRSEHEGASGEFMFDCDQHLEARKTCGDAWPCLLTHGCVVSAPRQGKLQIATAMEHLGAQGLHLHEQACLDNPASPLKAVFADIPRNKIKEIAGRGIHVSTLASWMYFILSNIVPRPQLAPTGLRSLGSWDVVPEAESDDE